jgi:general secretion pathway protein A
MYYAFIKGLDRFLDQIRMGEGCILYKEYFRLADYPFSIAPDPAYLYMSQKHREALAHLIYGVNSEGAFVVLTGEVGTGKTTICRCMLGQLPENCDIAFILNPRLTEVELLATICDEIGIAQPADPTSVVAFINRFNRHLLDSHAAGRKTLLVIDEAQNLDSSVLEQLRLLTNLETNRCKLLQIVLIGQPELRDMLERRELRQLSQRITARFHLDPLSKRDIFDYVRHRLTIAGVRYPLFPPSLMGQLYRLSRGIPRVINLICDRALLGAFAQSKSRVDRGILRKAAREVLGNTRNKGLFNGKIKLVRSWMISR